MYGEYDVTVQEHYAVVLQDLMDKKNATRARIDDLIRLKDSLVQELERLSAAIQALEVYRPPASKHLATSEQVDTYKAMSMRWACLKCLHAVFPKSMTTAQIAAELVQGGYPSSANLTSKLSAILGQMVQKGEVLRDADESSWALTGFGNERWTGIINSDKYIHRFELASRGTIQNEEEATEGV